MAGNIPMTAGLGLYPMTNEYTNAIAASDMYSSALNSQSSLNSDPMMNMNSSIFNNAANTSSGTDYLSGLSTLGTTPTQTASNPTVSQMGNGTVSPTTSQMGSATPFTGNYGYGFGYNPDDYYRYMDKNQDYMINYQVNQQEKMRNADMRVNSPYESISLSAKLLHDKIKEDEQQQIIPAFKKYCEQITSMYGTTDKNDILARAEQIYQSLYRNTIEDDLKANGKDSFTQGMLQAMSFGIADNKTAAENGAELTGEEVGRSDRAKKIAGNLTGAAAIGASTTIGINVLSKTFNWKMFKNKPLIGLGVGIAAGVIAVMKNLGAI